MRFLIYSTISSAVGILFLFLEFCKVYTTEIVYNRYIRTEYPMPSAATDLAGLLDVFLYFMIRPIFGSLLIWLLVMLLLYRKVRLQNGFLFLLFYHMITDVLLLIFIEIRAMIHFAFDFVLLVAAFYTAQAISAKMKGNKQQNQNSVL